MIVTAVYSTSSSTITFIGCLIFIMVIFGLIFISLKTDCCQYLTLSCQTNSTHENVNDKECMPLVPINQTISEVSETQSATRKDTGKYLSEVLILASTNQQYDDRLFTELPVQFMKTTSWVSKQRQKQFVYTTCSPDVLSLLFTVC